MSYARDYERADIELRIKHAEARPPNDERSAELSRLRKELEEFDRPAADDRDAELVRLRARVAELETRAPESEKDKRLRQAKALGDEFNKIPWSEMSPDYFSLFVHRVFDTLGNAGLGMAMKALGVGVDHLRLRLHKQTEATAEIDTLRAELRGELERVKAIRYVGTFQHGKSYQAGCFCTHAGSLWTAHVATSATPGKSTDWQLCAKGTRG